MEKRACGNLSLFLDRLAPFERQYGRWELSAAFKARRNARFDPAATELFKALGARWEAMLKDFTTEQFTATPESRLITGLGATHILETSITLHRTYGLPFLPGSGIKGVARAYAELVEGRIEGDREFDSVFGVHDRAGEVVFFDAIPTRLPDLKPDVMNPHYGEYYQGGNTPPADWLSPVPVYFLVIGKTPFRFAVATRCRSGRELLDTAVGWLKGGLIRCGVGAKTSQGYGFFVI